MHSIEKWHLREPKTSHILWFRNLLDLHSLTNAWIKGLKREDLSDRSHLKRVFTPGISKVFDQIEFISKEKLPEELEKLLDERHPTEVLENVDRSIWNIHLASYRKIFDSVSDAEKDAVSHLLEQLSFEEGRKKANEHWKLWLKESATLTDIRPIAASSLDTFYFGYPSQPASLVRRTSRDWLEIELLHCPHQSPYPEIREYADALCSLSTYWLKGFIYECHTRAVIETTFAAHGKRCVQVWRFSSLR